MKKHFAILIYALILLLSGIELVRAADGRFIGDVVAEWQPNGRDMELTEAFTYIDGRGDQWAVPKGTVVDGASIPRALWSVVGSPFTGKYRKASVIHDYFCRSMSRPWQDVHQIFFRASLTEGNTLFHARLMYGTVYAWGPRWEMVDGKPVRTRDALQQPTDKEFQDLAEWIKGSDPSLSDIAAYADTRFPRSIPTAEKRVALVIGNSGYKHAGELTNPKNDATEMSAALKKVGFQVIDGFDLNKGTFDRKIRDFANALSGAEVGLFFYAGHGLQVAGQNYLVPTDAELTTAASLEFEMVRLDVVHRIMEHAAQTNILFLDACRNNPLARNLARALGTRSAEIGRGLAAVESGSGTLISFSTQPGNVALDGTGRNSPFAAALAKQVSTSSDDLSALLIAVRNDVMKATQRKQVPWEHSALTRRFYFKAERQAPVVSAAPTPAWRLSEAAEAWDRTKDTTNIAALELFMGRYKDTYYADLARLRIAELKNKQTAVTTPSPKAALHPLSDQQKQQGDTKARIDALRFERIRSQIAIATSTEFLDATLRGEPTLKPEIEARRRQLAAQAQRDVEEGDRHYFGRGVPRDYVKAREGFEKAAAAGHAGAMNGLGVLYAYGLGVDRDYVEARRWYEKSVAGGFAHAMVNLGDLYRLGWGVPQDYGKARDLYEKGIAAGNTSAMNGLGWLYNNGWGVARDYTKARELYEKAVATGHANAMNNFGALYELGQGVSKDQEKARQWYEKAAAAGDDYGMNNLGRYYQNGWGVPQDYGKARDWFEKAAAAGNRFGRANLAKLLDEGKGGPADFPRAAKLLLEAARSGNRETIDALQGDMKKWSSSTRSELKRELARLGHHKGPIDDTWDGAAQTAAGRYLARGR